MQYDSGINFDIDVDVSGFLRIHRGQSLSLMPRNLTVDSRVYEQAMLPKTQRHPYIQRIFDNALHNQLLALQWQSAALQQWERRHSMRAPIISRVHLASGGHVVACDISRHGLRASGRPRQGLMDVEFKLPGLAFPVEARAEVVDFKDAAVIPLMSLKFVDIDHPFLDHIENYVERRMARQKLAA